RTSCCPRSVSNTLLKKVEAGTVRSPDGPRITNSASRVNKAVGGSDAGSPCATEPPMVARWRTCGSPTWPNTWASRGQCLHRLSASRRLARRRAYRAPVALRRHWASYVGHAEMGERVDYRVHHGRWRGDGARLAHSLDSQLVRRGGRFAAADDHLGDVGRGRD